jgi:hypothetical protein
MGTATLAEICNGPLVAGEGNVEACDVVVDEGGAALVVVEEECAAPVSWWLGDEQAARRSPASTGPASTMNPCPLRRPVPEACGALSTPFSIARAKPCRW